LPIIVKLSEAKGLEDSSSASQTDRPEALMRIAFISDVHGNFPALNAVVNDARKSNTDKFIFLGDYVFDLPFSNEVVDLLRGLDNAYFIKGNKETYLMKMKSQDQSEWVYEQVNALYYTYRTLTPDAFDFLAGLDEEAYIRVAPGVTVFANHMAGPMHAKSRVKAISNSSSMYRIKMLKKPFTHEEYLEEFSAYINGAGPAAYFSGIGADIIAYGHDHLQGHGWCGDKLVINPGSCGQPLDFNAAAPYTIVDIGADGKLSVTEKRVPYDVEAVINEARKSEMYRQASIWCELCFLALRKSRDYYGAMFEIANRIKTAKGEDGWMYSNETWREAYEEFKRWYKNYDTEGISND
jgi:predicted phosphodiesterase